MRSIAWLSEKGGTAKTSSAVNTSVCLAKQGKRVLLIDCDPQANSSLVFLRGAPAEPPTLMHVLTRQSDAAATIRPTATPGLDIIPADTGLADVNTSLATEIGRERRLRLAMRDVDDAYDFVVCDTSPLRTLININVLNYVKEVYCPVDPGIFSLAGLVSLQGAVGEVVRELDNAELRISGLVLTRTGRDNCSRDVEAQVRATFGAQVCKASIPISTKINEAHSRYLSVIDYAPKSAGALAYVELTREIITHGEVHGNRPRLYGAPDHEDGPGRRKGGRTKRAAG